MRWVCWMLWWVGRWVQMVLDVCRWCCSNFCASMILLSCHCHAICLHLPCCIIPASKACRGVRNCKRYCWVLLKGSAFKEKDAAVLSVRSTVDLIECRRWVDRNTQRQTRMFSFRVRTSSMLSLLRAACCRWITAQAWWLRGSWHPAYSTFVTSCLQGTGPIMCARNPFRLC